MISLYKRVIVTRKIPEENLLPGDIGTVVEEHRDPQGKVIGYELELFSANGDTRTASSVPVDAIREPTFADRLCSRIDPQIFEFERDLVDCFPTLASDVAEHSGLLHVVMGHLYHLTQEEIQKGKWDKVEAVFHFLDQWIAKGNLEVENAIRVSYLECFEFGGYENQIRDLLGPTLCGLYEDQMKYMEELARKAAEQPFPADPAKPDG
jgi:hypothetical protein